MALALTHSLTLTTDGCTNFRKFLIEGTKPNLKKIAEYVDRCMMLVTALAPVIGYDKASKIAHHVMDHDLTLKAAALRLCQRRGIRPRGRSRQDGQTLRRQRGLTHDRRNARFCPHHRPALLRMKRASTVIRCIRLWSGPGGNSHIQER